jgi:hypothetical protein
MRNRRAVLAVCVYLTCAAIAGYIATLGKFAGIYLVALTLPWSLLGVWVLDLIDTTLLDNWAWGVGISCTGVLANSLILYRLLRNAAQRPVSSQAAIKHDDEQRVID